MNPYHAGLKKPGFTLCPVVPTCRVCGAETAYLADDAPRTGRRAIVLTGTCASGKSTIAGVLLARYGFGVIDGDCAMDAIRHKRGLARFAYNGPEMLDEVAQEVDILLALGYDVVISHVVVADDLDVYREMLKTRGVDYRIVLLWPDIGTALMRSKTRTCFGSVTPEEWVRHFHDQLTALVEQKQDDVMVLDNTVYTAAETADRIVRLWGISEGTSG